MSALLRQLVLFHWLSLVRQKHVMATLQRAKDQRMDAMLHYGILDLYSRQQERVFMVYGSVFILAYRHSFSAQHFEEVCSK